MKGKHFRMKKTTKLVAVAAAVAMAFTGLSVGTAANAACNKTSLTILGTIKPEIKDQFLAAVKDYNASQSCYTVTSLPSDQNLSFLANVTPLYASHHAPTIMYGLQDIPNMASKVIDWTGSKLAKAAPVALLDAAKVGKQLAGVPSTVESFGLLYNKKVLDKAGVNPDSITTRSALEAAFKKIQKTGVGAVRFSAIWWSLGAHFTNEYFAHAAPTHEGRLAVLDQLADGKKKLSSDKVFQDYLATWALLKDYNQAKPNLTDTEYNAAVADLAAGKVGFWFMGNWAEPNLLQAAPTTDFGIMQLPISNDPKAYGNTSVAVGVPGYFMIDKTQSTADQRAGAQDFLNWLFLTEAGQHHVSDVAGEKGAGGMGFIPIYAGSKVQASTFMSKQIAKFVAAGKSIEWINTYYPAGGQEKYGASGQKFMTNAITAAQYAAELEKAWKGSVKTWRGAKVKN
jgi:raffinose/stachyose/melibiose transport system substrate-binding protein